MAKRRGAASKLAAVIDEEPVAIQKPQEKIQLPEKAPDPAPKAPEFIVDRCGSCGVERRIVYYDADWNWEPPGHPDHFSRPICTECISSEFARNDCCVAVYEAMRRKLTDSDMSLGQINEAIHTAWRTFNVDYDNDALIKIAKQLKVKSGWLKGR